MNVDEMLHGVREGLRAQTVFGEAVERDGLTVIPAATVRGGGGGGGDNQHNGGGGFGLQARPAGAFVIRDGEVAWRPAIDVDRLLRGALAATAGVLALHLWLSRR
jgi:uncharacterized spore protein YtfJ